MSADSKERFDFLAEKILAAKKKNLALREELGINAATIESFNAVLMNVVPSTLDDLELIAKALEDYNQVLERDLKILTLGRGIKKMA